MDRHWKHRRASARWLTPHLTPGDASDLPRALAEKPKRGRPKGKGLGGAGGFRKELCRLGIVSDADDASAAAQEKEARRPSRGSAPPPHTCVHYAFFLTRTRCGTSALHGAG